MITSVVDLLLSLMEVLLGNIIIFKINREDELKLTIKIKIKIKER